MANRQLFIERAEQALARVRRGDHSLAVLFVDLDRFKQVNDSMGHAAGDQLLIEAAARLRELVRQSDDVARFGGDEFAILCEDLEHEDDAAVIATLLFFQPRCPLFSRETLMSQSVRASALHSPVMAARRLR